MCVLGGIHFASFYNFAIGFWKCCDNAVFVDFDFIAYYLIKCVYYIRHQYISLVVVIATTYAIYAYHH